MKPVIVEIADAVVEAINNAALSQSVQAERHYLPEFELAEMDGLHVSVVPAEVENEPADRTRNRMDCKIHVAVQQRVARQQPPGLNNELIDKLMYLVEEIGNLFRHEAALPGYQPARWIKTEIKPIYDPKHLKESGLFTGLIALTFVVHT